MKPAGNIKKEVVPISIEYRGTEYKGLAEPVAESCNEKFCTELNLKLNGKNMGNLHYGPDKKWTLSEITEQDLVNKIGEQIELWYDL